MTGIGSLKEDIKEEHYHYQPEEQMEIKVGNILHKLDMNAAPGPSGLRNAHLMIWTGVFAPPAADEAIQHLEDIISDMANDKLPGWFMQTVQSAELMALVKAEKKPSSSPTFGAGCAGCRAASATRRVMRMNSSSTPRLGTTVCSSEERAARVCTR